MTDTLLLEDEIQSGDDLGFASEDVIPTKKCAKPGCENNIPPNSPPARKYCDDHFKGKTGANKKAKESAPKIVIDLGNKTKGDAKTAQAARTAQGATTFLVVMSTAMAAMGNEADAAAIQNGAQLWGQAMGELGKYHNVVNTIFAPAGGDGPVGAYIGVFLASMAIVLPILDNHGKLPGSVATKLAGATVAAQQMAPDGDPVAA